MYVSTGNDTAVSKVHLISPLVPEGPTPTPPEQSCVEDLRKQGLARSLPSPLWLHRYFHCETSAWRVCVSSHNSVDVKQPATALDTFPPIHTGQQRG